MSSRILVIVGKYKCRGAGVPAQHLYASTRLTLLVCSENECVDISMKLSVRNCVQFRDVRIIPDCLARVVALRVINDNS